jgi:hypothetical protein
MYPIRQNSKIAMSTLLHQLGTVVLTFTATLAFLLIALRFMSLMMTSDEFEIKLNQFGGLISLSPEIVAPCNPSVPKRMGRATELLVAQAAHHVSPNPNERVNLEDLDTLEENVTINRACTQAINIYISSTKTPEQTSTLEGVLKRMCLPIREVVFEFNISQDGEVNIDKERQVQNCSNSVGLAWRKIHRAAMVTLSSGSKNRRPGVSSLC